MNEIQATVLPFDPPAARAVAALTDYFRRLGKSGLVRNREAPPHIVARSRSFTAGSASIAWTLGAMVLARAAGDAPAPAEDALRRESRALHERLDREFREVPKLLLRKDARCDATESVQLLLREIAMEERGLELVFESSADTPPKALTRPLDPALAAALSFLQLLTILLVEAQSNPLVSMERAASEWWFDTWSAPPRGELDEVTHAIREMEFSFFDREMVSLNDTLASACTRAMPSNAFTVRQRALLDGVRRGVCSIFAVRQRRGPVTVLDDLLSGGRYEVCEHDMGEPYGEGDFIAGRLIPIAEIGWIRSPGAMPFKMAPEIDRSRLRERLADRSDVYPSLLAEIFIAVARGHTRGRRKVDPAPSRDSARDTLEDFYEFMLLKGLAHRIPADSDGLSEGVSESETSELPIYLQQIELPVDEVIKQWLQALQEQGRPRSWGADHDAQQARRRNTKRRKRRRSR